MSRPESRRADDSSINIPQLTFLRFIAATGVVLFHFRDDIGSLQWAYPALAKANTAVSFFFVLSGFILAHVYASRGVRKPLDFYIARFARIMPLYWIALLLVAAYHAYKGMLNWPALLLSVPLLQAWVPGYAMTLNSPGWSLSVEMLFYLSFPFVLAALQRLDTTTRILGCAVALWCASLLMHIMLLDRIVPDSPATLTELAYYHPLGHLGTFVLGAAAGLLFPRFRQSIAAHAGWMIGVAAVTIVVLLLWPNPFAHYHHNGLFAPLYLMVVLGLAATPTTTLSRLLAWAPLVLLGEASYGVYILQHPVSLFYMPVAQRLGLGGEAAFWLYYVVLVLISIVAFKYVEAPLRGAIKGLFSSRSPKPRAVPQVADG